MCSYSCVTDCLAGKVNFRESNDELQSAWISFSTVRREQIFRDGRDHLRFVIDDK